MRALPALLALCLALAGCSSGPGGDGGPAVATEDPHDVQPLGPVEDGNRAPTGRFAADVVQGEAPLRVVFEAGGSDPEGSEVAWVFDAESDGEAEEAGTGLPATIAHEYTVPGAHVANLTLSDGAWRVSFRLDIEVAGNATVAGVTWGPLEAPLRPGSSLGGYCTFNFLFTDAAGRAYVGTAAHCTELNETLQLAGHGPVARVVYDSDETPGADAAVDFTLAELLPGKALEANPSMRGHPGPTGAAAADEGGPGDLVGIYGYGLLLGDSEPTRPRQGAIVDNDGRLYRIDMPAVNGDSGAPIVLMEGGKAFGIVSHYGLGAVPPSTDEGPVMAFILEELAKAGFHVQVATA